MNQYEHIMRLSFWHPTIDPDRISTALNIEPTNKGCVGHPRMTRKGTKLNGTYPESYWSADPFNYGWRPNLESEIADAIEELISALEPHTAFLNEFVSDGGRGAIIVSGHSHHNFAVELAPATLGRLSRLQLSFWIDYYPGPFVA